MTISDPIQPLATDLFFIDAMIALVERQRDAELRAIARIDAVLNRSEAPCA